MPAHRTRLTVATISFKRALCIGFINQFRHGSGDISRGLIAALLCVQGAQTAFGQSKPAAAAGMELVFEDHFEHDDLSRWDFTERGAWRIAGTDGEHKRVLELFRQSRYAPIVRSPVNVALVKGHDVADFVLDVTLRSTTRDYDHRDMCLIFGHQDPSHFYYVHFGKKADEAANSIFLVDGAPRRSIAQERTKGTPWTDGWHHVRIIRTAGDGAINVYFDNMNEPAMIARDRHFLHGQIGVGSFDDTGMFDAVLLWAR